MKLVIVISDLTRSGGTEKATANLVDLLATYYEIIIYSASSSEKSDSFFSFSKAKVIHFGMSPMPHSPFSKIKWFSMFSKLINKQFSKDQPHFVLGTGHNISVCLAYLKKANYKAYAVEHIDYNTIPKVSKILMNHAYKKLDGIVALSDTAKEKLSKLNKNISVIPNNIEKKSLAHIQKENRIILVGRISPEKGYERLIPIAKFLLQNYPNWTIDIFGDGPIKEDLELVFKNENLTNIVLHGAVKNIDYELQKAKIFAMTSYTEAMPMVILEAKAHGLPVIAYQNEGTNLLVQNDEDGFLIENDNPKQFILKLSLLIDDKNDICKTLGVKAIGSIYPYSNEEVLKKWLYLLKS